MGAKAVIRPLLRSASVPTSAITSNREVQDCIGPRKDLILLRAKLVLAIVGNIHWLSVPRLDIKLSIQLYIISAAENVSKIDTRASTGYF